MHTKVADFLSRINGTASKGIGIYPLEISRALNLVPAEIDGLLDDGFEIEDCSRINFSYRISWIDVLLVLSKHAQRRQFIITYDAQNDELVGTTQTNQKFETIDGVRRDLPFALMVRSHTVDVVASEEQMSKVTTRRDLFVQGLVASLFPFMGLVSPAMAAPTAYTTNPQTGSNKATQTSKGTSALTTPNDQDTKTDTVTDNTTDYKADPTQDHREDK